MPQSEAQNLGQMKREKANLGQMKKKGVEIPKFLTFDSNSYEISDVLKKVLK